MELNIYYRHTYLLVKSYLTNVRVLSFGLLFSSIMAAKTTVYISREYFLRTDDIMFFEFLLCNLHAFLYDYWLEIIIYVCTSFNILGFNLTAMYSLDLKQCHLNRKKKLINHIKLIPRLACTDVKVTLFICLFIRLPCFHVLIPSTWLSSSLTYTIAIKISIKTFHSYSIHGTGNRLKAVLTK